MVPLTLSWGVKTANEYFGNPKGRANDELQANVIHDFVLSQIILKRCINRIHLIFPCEILLKTARFSVKMSIFLKYYQNATTIKHKKAIPKLTFSVACITKMEKILVEF